MILSNSITLKSIFYARRLVPKIYTLMERVCAMENSRIKESSKQSDITTQANGNDKKILLENGNGTGTVMDICPETAMPSSSGLAAKNEVADGSEDYSLLGPSGQWKKPTESLFLLQQLARKGLQPKQILDVLYPRYSSSISDEIPDAWIMQLLRELCEQRTRQKLAQFNTFDDAVELFRRSKRIMVVTGAGVSVSCGIPDFRSENGVYARLKKDFSELPTPTAMFDIDFFRANPRPFYNFAREIFPGQFRPSLSHMFIKFLEEENKLLRNYTQNIDTLERTAGIGNLVECHGSFAMATCLNCKHKVESSEIREHVFAQRVAHCSKCSEGVMKPDIVFFGEELDDSFHDQMGADHSELDLLVVIGSSMQVRPVSLIPYNISPQVPQILINRELLSSYPADIKLLGNCDPILVQIALAMGGQMREKMLNEIRTRQEKMKVGEKQLPRDLLERIEQKSPEQSFGPRSISLDEFKRLVDAGKEEEEGEIKRKRPKLEEEEDKVKGEGGTSGKLWDGNYVPVEAKLPSTDSTLLVPPNVNVFVGAEMFYDRDQDTFVHRIGTKERRFARDSASLSASSDDTSSPSSSADSDDERGGSLPPLSGSKNETFGQKAKSCPPTSFSSS